MEVAQDVRNWLDGSKEVRIWAGNPVVSMSTVRPRILRRVPSRRIGWNPLVIFASAPRVLFSQLRRDRLFPPSRPWFFTAAPVTVRITRTVNGFTLAAPMVTRAS